MASYPETLLDQYDRPIIGAMVSGVQAGATIATTTTDALGQFTLTVPAGVYTIQYRIAGSLVREDDNIAIGVQPPGSILATSDLTGITLPANQLAIDTTAHKAYIGGASGNIPLASQAYADLPAGNALNVRKFGAVGNYSTDDAPAFVAAVAAAQSLGVSVYIPNGNYRIASPVDFGRVAFVGESETGTVIYTDNVNGSLFKITANATLKGNHYHSLTFINGIPGDYTSSAAIEVTGDASGFFQYNAFKDMTFYGFRDGMKITKATHATPFGEESLYSFNTHENLTFQGNVYYGRYAIRFTAGSGTGNVFDNVRGNVGIADASAAYLRYEGACVVGDITFSNSQLGGGAPIAISIDAACVYLSNITFPGVQFDAGCTVPLLVGATAVPLKSIHLVGSNFGGLTTLGAGVTPFIAESVIHDLQASQWLAGNNHPEGGSGARVIPAFSVAVDTNTGVSVKVMASGAVGGVGGAIIASEYLIQRGAGAAVVSLVGSNYVNGAGLSTGGSTITLTTSIASGVVTFTMNYTSSSASNVTAQIATMGGTCKVTRL